MNPCPDCNVAARAVLLSAVVSLGASAADNIAPNFADSPRAQRERALTLIGGQPEPGGGVLAAMRRLLRLQGELRSVIVTAEARLSETEMREDDPRAKKLRATRDAARKNQAEVQKLLEEITAQLRSQ